MHHLRLLFDLIPLRPHSSDPAVLHAYVRVVTLVMGILHEHMCSAEVVRSTTDPAAYMAIRLHVRAWPLVLPTVPKLSDKVLAAAEVVTKVRDFVTGVPLSAQALHLATTTGKVWPSLDQVLHLGQQWLEVTRQGRPAADLTATEVAEVARFLKDSLVLVCTCTPVEQYWPYLLRAAETHAACGDPTTGVFVWPSA